MFLVTRVLGWRAPPSQMTKATPDLRSLARAHTELSIQTLAGIARNSTSDQARVAASQALLDRGWGKAIQPHTGEESGDIRVVIRQIIDVEKSEPSLIEHETPRD
jgi:hypothetical protein